MFTIIFGAGRCYQMYSRMFKAFPETPLRIYDQKLEQRGVDEYDGIQTITYKEIVEIEMARIYLCIYDARQAEEIVRRLDDSKFIIHKLPLDAPLSLSGDQLRKTGGGVYQDVFGNKVYFDDSCPQDILINFKGGGFNTIKIGKNLTVHKRLNISVGVSSNLQIGDGCIFDTAAIVTTLCPVIIGNDCLFSYDVEIRNADGHHIFDKNSGRRINSSKKILIGNHVWVGMHSVILKGTDIGDGCVIGANSVVNGAYDNNVLIAGNPSRAIKKSILWTRDDTYLYNHSNVSESTYFGEGGI